MARFPAKERQFLLPMLKLIEQAEAAVDEVFNNREKRRIFRHSGQPPFFVIYLNVSCG